MSVHDGVTDLTASTLPRLMGGLVIEELELGIGGAAERACLGDTHVHGRLHGRLGPAHVGGHFVCDDGILGDFNESINDLRLHSFLTMEEARRSCKLACLRMR